MKNFKAAFRYSELAIRILSQYESKEWHARVVAAVYIVINPLRLPFRDSLNQLKDAHQSGLVVGDIHVSPS